VLAQMGLTPGHRVGPRRRWCQREVQSPLLLLGDSVARLKEVRVFIPASLLEQIDQLVERGEFATRADAIRTALRLLLERYAMRVGRLVVEEREAK